MLLLDIRVGVVFEELGKQAWLQEDGANASCLGVTRAACLDWRLAVGKVLDALKRYGYRKTRVLLWYHRRIVLNVPKDAPATLEVLTRQKKLVRSENQEGQPGHAIDVGRRDQVRNMSLPWKVWIAEDQMGQRLYRRAESDGWIHGLDGIVGELEPGCHDGEILSVFLRWQVILPIGDDLRRGYDVIAPSSDGRKKEKGCWSPGARVLTLPITVLSDWPCARARSTRWRGDSVLVSEVRDMVSQYLCGSAVMQLGLCSICCTDVPMSI